jgi:hypothetical protein
LVTALPHGFPQGTDGGRRPTMDACILPQKRRCLESSLPKEYKPAMLLGFKKNGDKGCKENPNAPPEREYQLVLDALRDVSPEELAQLKEEARRKKLVEQES